MLLADRPPALLLAARSGWWWEGPRMGTSGGAGSGGVPAASATKRTIFSESCLTIMDKTGKSTRDIS